MRYTDTYSKRFVHRHIIENGRPREKNQGENLRKLSHLKAVYMENQESTHTGPGKTHMQKSPKRH